MGEMTMTENEALKIAIHCLGVHAEQEVCEECQAYRESWITCKDIARTAISALKEIQLYKDNKLCLIPKNIYSKQCCELDAYKEIGTVEECREAMANKKKCEKQWHNDMENPLEPIKVYSALKSEILKLELRIENRPKDISILDYTVIAALQKVLKNNLEGMEDE